MDLRKIFINDAGRLRSGWRLGTFVGVYFVLSFLATAVVRILYAFVINLAPRIRSVGHLEDLVFRVILLVTSLGAGYVCTRLLEGLSWRALGLWFHAHWLRDLLVGSAIGIASLMLAAASAFAAGGLSFSFSPVSVLPAALKTLVFTAVLFIIAALAEEALFRGYPLQTLTRAKLAWLGVLLTSLPFAAVHLNNPNAGSRLAAANTALAGIWLAVAYLKTRSLWFPLGVHWAWNWALGSLFGLPVSGISLSTNPLMRGMDLGPAWLTGGNYGIEGGVACTIAVVVSTFFIWRTGWVSATQEMRKLTSKENPRTVPAQTMVQLEDS